MPISGGEESETALAEPFEAPALAAFPEFAHVNTSAPVHLIGVFFYIRRGKLGQSQHGSLLRIV